MFSGVVHLSLCVLSFYFLLFLSISLTGSAVSGAGEQGQAAGVFLSVWAGLQCIVPSFWVKAELRLNFTHHVCTKRQYNDTTALNIRTYNEMITDHMHSLVLVDSVFWLFTSLGVFSTSGWLLEPKGWSSFPITPSGWMLATWQQ